MVSMPKYANKALPNFKHPIPRRDQYAPHQWRHPNYGATNQPVIPLDTSPPIPGERKIRIQKIVVILLYYARDVYYTTL